jgi:hypothetical protein
MKIISKEAAQHIVDTVKDVCSQNINFIDENGLSGDALCRGGHCTAECALQSE